MSQPGSSGWGSSGSGTLLCTGHTQVSCASCTHWIPLSSGHLGMPVGTKGETMETGRQRTEEEWRRYWDEYWDRARGLARGRWDSILGSLAPALLPAIDADGRRHVPCPVHGGKDGFRFFKGMAETGRAICNTCGHFMMGSQCYPGSMDGLLKSP